MADGQSYNRIQLKVSQFIYALPLIPETLFLFDGALVVGVILLAVGGAVGGAAFPVWSALRKRPVDML